MRANHGYLWLGWSLGLMGLLASCSSAPAKELTATSTTTLGPEGGTAVSPDGTLELSFDPGTLSASTQVTIEVDRGANGFAGPVYRTGPSGAQLGHPVHVAVTVPEGMVGDLTLARVDGSKPERVAGASYDRAHRKVVGELLRLSSYALLSTDLDGGTPPESLIDAGFLGCRDLNEGPAPVPPGNDGGVASGSSWRYCPIGEAEPNDSPDNAQPLYLQLNSGVEVALTWDGTPDVFSFDVPSLVRADLIAETFDEAADCPVDTDLDTEVSLLDSHGNVLASRTHGFFRCGAVDYEANPEAASLGTGTYYLRVLQDGVAPLGRAYRFRVWLIQR